jgi:hypothetical protein
MPWVNQSIKWYYFLVFKIYNPGWEIVFSNSFLSLP